MHLGAQACLKHQHRLCQTGQRAAVRYKHLQTAGLLSTHCRLDQIRSPLDQGRHLNAQVIVPRSLTLITVVSMADQLPRTIMGAPGEQMVLCVIVTLPSVALDPGHPQWIPPSMTNVSEHRETAGVTTSVVNIAPHHGTLVWTPCEIPVARLLEGPTARAHVIPATHVSHHASTVIEAMT
jgi:hypothetical protein